MATQKTDFLKFNAYSMKELITRKMSEDSKFTDQIYEGSNLAILIDLVAYMYQVLVYQLNNAASESMFSDTQIYENINRLVKLIGYHPRGCKTAELWMYIIKDSGFPNGDLKFPMFSRLDSGITDSRGKPIYFSINDIVQIESERFHYIELLNGQFKMYPEIFTASGTENEIFILSELKSDSENEQFVDNDHFKVFIKRDGQFIGTFRQDTEELLIDPYPNKEGERLTLYNSDSQVYSIRMNENKNYEVKFGNGVTAQKLQKGDKLYIFYLETNGLDGEIDVGSIDWTDKKFEHSAQMFGLVMDDYRDIFALDTANSDNPILPENNATDENWKEYYSLTPKNYTTSKPQSEENVEDIKETAPQWFKTGNRLLTRNDYETFVKKNNSDVIDVKCMNNWEYLATFFKWLYNCGIKYHQEDAIPGRHYFDEVVFLKNNLPMVDAADANNIYLWVKTKNDFTLTDLTNKLNDDGVQNIKILTSEIQVLKPISVIFDICAAYVDMAPLMADFNDFYSHATTNSYLEITLDENCIFVNTYIKNRIIKIFKTYFNINNLKLGQNINNNEILDQIYAINGVQRVRTVYQPSSSSQIDGFNPRAVDGISFITYSGSFINLGEDVNISNSVRHIEEFQFPEFIQSKLNVLDSRIKVIKKQLTSMSSVKF